MLRPRLSLSAQSFRTSRQRSTSSTVPAISSRCIWRSDTAGKMSSCTSTAGWSLKLGPYSETSSEGGSAVACPSPLGEGSGEAPPPRAPAPGVCVSVLCSVLCSMLSRCCPALVPHLSRTCPAGVSVSASCGDEGRSLSRCCPALVPSLSRFVPPLSR